MKIRCIFSLLEESASTNKPVAPVNAPRLSMSRPKGEWDPIFGKAPRKGTLKYDIWKRNVQSDKKITEGGWMTSVTQGTVISPSIVKKSLSILEQFFKDFNRYLDSIGIAERACVGAPTGSSAYHDVDDEDKIYGDVDVQIVVPQSDPPMTLSQLQAYWNDLASRFVQDKQPAYVSIEHSKKGHPILALGNDQYVQIDFMWHEEQNADWGRYRATPERGLKGLLYGNLFSVLGDMLDMSIQYAGVQYKTSGGNQVPFSKHKQTELHTLSNRPDSFLIDILTDLHSRYGSTPAPVVDNLLKRNPGVSKDDVQSATLVQGIKGLARSFEQSGLYGHGPLDKYKSAEQFVNKFVETYTAKAEKELDNKKRDSAETPEAKQRATADLEKIRTGLAKVRTLFLQN
jgi:hypothetical protein